MQRFVLDVERKKSVGMTRETKPNEKSGCKCVCVCVRVCVRKRDRERVRVVVCVCVHKRAVEPEFFGHKEKPRKEALTTNRIIMHCIKYYFEKKLGGGG